MNVALERFLLPAFAFLVCALAAPVPSAAGGEGGEGVIEIPEIEVEEKSPEEEGEAERFNLAPATVEKIEDRPGVHVTTEEVLESTPSVRIRKFGSHGSPSIISLRGSDAAQTLVLLDDIPLNEASSGLVDLSTVPSYLLESVSVIRGFSTSAPSPFHPGGVVKLASMRPEPGVHAGAGLRLGVFPLKSNGKTGENAGQELKPPSSLFRFGALRQLVLSSSVFDGTLGCVTAGSFEHAEGDFVFFNDNGTVYNTGDDRFMERRNNGHGSISALFKLLYLPDMWSELTLSFLEFNREAGVPGLDVLQAGGTELMNGRQYLSLAYDRYSEHFDVPSLSAKGYLKSSSIQWRDPLGEISNARQDSRSRNLGSGLVLSGCERIGPAVTLLWGLVGGLEKWKGEVRYARGAGSSQEALRLTAGWHFTSFIDLMEGRVRLQGSLRGDLVGDRTTGGEGGEDGSANEFFLSPGAGVEINPLRWLSISANVSSSNRPATLVELFGNQGMVVGNAGLEPEKAVSFDAGVVFDFTPLVPVDDLEVEYRFFRKDIRNLIVFIQNSQKTMIARNIGRAETSGVELSLKAGFLDMVLVKLGYSFLDPRDRSGIEPYHGRMLPNRPRHDLFMDASVSRWSVTLAYELDFLAGGYIDRASMRPISRRLIHSASIEWEPARLAGFYVGLELWNIGNVIRVERNLEAGERRFVVGEAVSDVEGYPLPGFAVYLSAGMKM